MLLPELEYISMVEATNKFEVTIEHLRGLIEQKLLLAYVRETKPPYRYAKITTPHWEGDTLPYCQAVFIDETGNIIDQGKNVMYPAGFPYAWVLVRSEELRALGQVHANVDHLIELSAQETPEELCNQLKLKNLTYKEIAKTLKKAFPNINPSRIGRLLPANPGTYITSDGHRKQGCRLLK